MRTDTLWDSVGNRRRFLKLLSLAGLGLTAAGFLASPAADAATRTKKKITAKRNKLTEYRKAKKAARARPDRELRLDRVNDRFEPPRYARGPSGGLEPEKTISLYVPQTGEKLVQVPFWTEGVYVPDAIQEISHLMRDWRNDEVRAVDPGLLDLLYELRGAMGTTQPIQVVCGYRSPETNAMLVGRTRGVARQSLHMQARAIDVRVQGLDSRHIQRAALSLERGGVGYYPRQGFVHVDTGPVRQWRG